MAKPITTTQTRTLPGSQHGFAILSDAVQDLTRYFVQIGGMTERAARSKAFKALCICPTQFAATHDKLAAQRREDEIRYVAFEHKAGAIARRYEAQERFEAECAGLVVNIQQIDGGHHA